MEIRDSYEQAPAQSSKVVASSPIMELVEEQFRYGEAEETLTRQYLRHASAVGVLVLDDQDRVLVIQQYRHPVGARLWETPAGLLDGEGESMLGAAQRELEEEADIRAETWHTLVDVYTTPGCSNEGVRLYLAQQLSDVPEAELHARGEEEAGIVPAWVPFDDAVTAAVAGRIKNSLAVTGLLALHAVRTGAGELRDPRAPWENHPRGVRP